MAQNKSDLGYLGEDFQFKLMRVFLDDKEFFQDLYGIINPNMITNPNLRRILSLMITFYKNNEIVPSYETVGMIVKDDTKGNEAEAMMLEETLKAISTTNLEAYEWIKSQAFRFFKQQNIIKAANEVLHIAGDGDFARYDECVEILSNALKQGEKKEMGVTILDDLNDTLSDDYRIAIPTGIEALDECLEGGIGKGELALIIGSQGFGKTSITTAIANHAATYKCEANNNNGFKILQIVFEDRPKQIRRKHLARICNIEARNLSKPEYIDEVNKKIAEYEDMDMLNNNLRIVRFPSGEKTASDIRNFVKNLINSGWRPDMVIIDYFECIDHTCFSNISNEFEREGKSMRKFEAMAGDLDMAVVLPTQGTKDSITQEVINFDKMQGSAKKSQITHIAISIARSLDDIDNNRATIALLKNRSGKSGKVWSNVMFNNGTCRISTDSCDEFGSALERSNMIKQEKAQYTANLLNSVRDGFRENKYNSML